MIQRLLLLISCLCVALYVPARANEVLYSRLFPGADARADWERTYSAEEQQRIEQLAGVKPAPRALRGVSFYRDGQLLGHAIADDVRGKHRPITFLMATDAALRVQAVEILAYRESHGGEVRSSDWRAQFLDKAPGSALVPGKDIVNIAGATISCRNLTLGVRVRLAALSVGIGSGQRVLIRRQTPAAAGASAAPRSRLLMGTVLAVKIDHSDAAVREEAEDAVFAEVARIEALLSDWRSDSALSLWQVRAREASTVMPAELAHVTEECLRLHAESMGAFDAGLGALTRLYRENAQPADDLLADALAASGLKNLEYRNATRAARLLHAQSSLDFGAFGKGYALRLAAQRLEQLGVQRGLLDFGGQLHALPVGEWPVQLAEPLPPRALRLKGHSLAVSSASERGQHILDPRTGKPAQGVRASLCIAPDPALADGWSTALFVLGKCGLELAENHGIAALVLDEQGRLHANERLMREYPALLLP